MAKIFNISKECPVSVFMPKIIRAIAALVKHYQRRHKLTRAEYSKLVRIENSDNPAMQKHFIEDHPILISESSSPERHRVFLIESLRPSEDEEIVVIEDHEPQGE